MRYTRHISILSIIVLCPEVLRDLQILAQNDIYSAGRYSFKNGTRVR